MTADDNRLVRASDVALLAYLPFMGTLAWTLPERSWQKLCAAIVHLSGGSRRGVRHRRAAIIADVFSGYPLAAEAERISVSLSIHHHIGRMQLLRSYRPAGWRPQIDLEGRQHLDDALATGKGAVLWVAPFAYNDLVTKMALHRAGFRVVHLSRRQHGLSTSRIGSRLINPLWTRVERRFLGERIVLEDDRVAGPLRHLVQSLREGNPISITCTSQGQRRATVPFFSSSALVAEGAPALALRTGARLLPVYTIGTAASRFRTRIGAPIEVGEGQDAATAIDAAVKAYMARIQPVILTWVDQFAGWEILVRRT